MKLFVTGIGTGIGKTVVSAALVSKFKADYWKPIQSGDLINSDSMKISRWSKGVFIHKERFRLNKPASPHESAAEEGVEIRLNDFELPITSNNLIIEGAGGLMVPLNDKDYMIDLISYLGLEVVFVIRDYLGVINHSLLSFMALKEKEIPIYLVVFNGEFNPNTITAIKKSLPENIRYEYFEELNDMMEI